MGVLQSRKSGIQFPRNPRTARLTTPPPVTPGPHPSPSPVRQRGHLAANPGWGIGGSQGVKRRGVCSKCGGSVRVIACIDDQDIIDRILAHLRDKKSTSPARPPLAPPSRCAWRIANSQRNAAR